MLAVVSVAAAMWIRRRRRGTVKTKEKGEQLVSHETPAFYSRMLDSLARRERTRADHETPLEFAASMQLPEVITVTDAYHRVRYGKQILTQTELSRIEIDLRRIEQTDVVKQT
jgi:hypothetical protein